MKWETILKSKKGFADIVWLPIAIFFMAILFLGFMTAYAAIEKRNQAKEVAQELVEIAADKGSIKVSAIEKRYQDMLRQSNINPDTISYKVTCDGNYDEVSGKVQHGEFIKATVLYDTIIEMPLGVNIPYKIDIDKTARSQKFYKELE